jgi:hypothetical protein
MFLISSLNGPFDCETSEGKGANAAYHVIQHIQNGKKTGDENLRKFLKGEIGTEEACKNDDLNILSKAYIPYSSIDEETQVLDLRQGMAFASLYIKAFDRDNDGAMTVEEAGPIGQLIDLIDPSGKITPGKFLSWLIFQDCADNLNGILSPAEVAKALFVVQNDPAFVVGKLRDIYRSYKINELEREFVLPVPR